MQLPVQNILLFDYNVYGNDFPNAMKMKSCIRCNKEMIVWRDFYGDKLCSNRKENSKVSQRA